MEMNKDTNKTTTETNKSTTETGKSKKHRSDTSGSQNY
jgi:hypothetical protein